MSAIRVTRRPMPKLYVFDRRLHHGMTGLILTALGIALCWHDRHDAPWWSDHDALRFMGPRR